MRINQLFCQFGKGFKEAMELKYNLIPYREINEPAIFFGCNFTNHTGYLFNHKGLGVVIWAGSDIKVLADIHPKNPFWGDMLKERQNLKHIAISKWIAEDLEKIGLPYISLPVTPHDHSYIKPCPPGECVYMYNPGNPIYNGGIYEEVKKRIPYKIIEASTGTYTRERLLEVYKECFIGLRFTEHDGLSNTVCEMGMMGRTVINNGGVPNCIHYDSIDSIITFINFAYKSKEKPELISEEVKKYLDIGEAFLNTEYYG